MRLLFKIAKTREVFKLYKVKAHVGTGVWRFDTLMMAVILCLTYMRTRDIRYCVITHVTCNLLGIFSAYYFVNQGFFDPL